MYNKVLIHCSIDNDTNNIFNSNSNRNYRNLRIPQMRKDPGTRRKILIDIGSLLVVKNRQLRKAEFLTIDFEYF